MFMVDLVQWWYLRGWGMFLDGLKRKLQDSADFFSFGILARTLFKPFRQISAGASGDTAESKLAAFSDRLVSRVVGLFARLAIMIAGAVVMLVEIIVGGLIAIVWPLMPVLPIVCIVLAGMGVKVW